MSSRVILSIICICFAASACENEPYQYPPLGLVSLLNHVTNVTNTYRYRDQKLYSYLSMASDTIAFMRFHYTGDQLVSIVTDSTKESMKVTSFYNAERTTVKDSTFLIDATGSTLISVRTVSYDDSDNPVSIGLTTFSGEGDTDELAELTWADGNVVKLVTYDLITGEKKLIRDLTITHDDQYCVYMKNRNYLFTLPLKDLFWLSKNNPLVLNDGTGDKKYTYWYNKLGYPSNFKTENGVLYGTSYIQVR